MQRLQYDDDEKITRKEYLKRKKKQARIFKKRSKLTYITIFGIFVLSAYLVTQIYVYSRENNFKYVETDAIKEQKVYNVYYVTEGYTYDPVYTLNSIYSNGFGNKTVYSNSGLTSIYANSDYVYGIKEGGLYRLVKSTNELEPLVEKDVLKYVLDNERIYYIETGNNKLKYFDINTKQIADLGIENVSELIIDENNLFTVIDAKTKKSLVRYDKNGENKAELTKDSNVSYIVQDASHIYFVNKKDENKIYVIEKSGNNETKLDDITSVADKGEIKEIDGSKYMYIEDNFLYYINSADSNTLWKINLDSKEKTQVISLSIEILQNIKGTVFYKVKNEMGVYLYTYSNNFMSQVTRRKLKEFYVDITEEIVDHDYKNEGI